MAKKIILLMSVIVFYLVGCSQQSVEDSSYDSSISLLSEEPLVKEVLRKVKADYGDGIKDFTIGQIDHVENASFGNLTFLMNDIRYEGVWYASRDENNWKIEQIEITQSDNSTPITVYQLGGLLNSKIQRDYFVVSGLVNDSRVKSIQIIYRELGMTALIMGDNQKTYLDAKVGVSEGIEEIKALDEDGTVLFSTKD